MTIHIATIQQPDATSQPTITAADIARMGLTTLLQVTTATLTVHVSAQRTAMRQGLKPFLTKPPGL